MFSKNIHLLSPFPNNLLACWRKCHINLKFCIANAWHIVGNKLRHEAPKQRLTNTPLIASMSIKNYLTVRGSDKESKKQKELFPGGIASKWQSW